MAADYTIVAELVVKNNSAPGLQGFDRDMTRMEDRTSRMGSRLSSMFRGLFGGLAAAFGGGMLARGVIGLNDELDQANAGMATLIGGLTNMPINNALEIARGQVQGLRQDAAVGVGELQDYLRGFQMLLGPGLSGGASLKQLRDLTRTSLAAGFAMRGTAGLEQAPMDIVQALTGGVNDRQTPIALAALKALGMEAGTFNKLPTAEKITTLTEAFGKFQGGVELMGQTWDARMATLQDGVKELLRTATRPLFNRWSEQLGRSIEFLEKNQALLDTVAQTIGDKLVKAYDHLIRQAGTYLSLVAAAAAYQGVGGAAGLSAAGGRMRGSMGLMSTGLGMGGASGIGTTLRTLAGAVGRVAGPLTIVTGLFMSVKGALEEYPELMVGIAGITQDFVGALASLGESFGFLTAKGSVLNQVGGLLVLAFGGLVKVASVALKVVASLVTGLGLMAQVMGGLLKAIAQAASGDFMAAKDSMGGIVDASFNARDQLREIWGVAREGQNTETPDLSGGDISMDGLTPTKSVTNINGPVRIEIRADTMEDPNRVLIAFRDVVDDLNRNPRQARRNLSIGRG